MVAHEAVRINKPLIVLDRIGKGHEKHPEVFNIGKDVLPGIHPGSYMVKTPSNSMRIGRTIKNIPYTGWQKARPDSFPFFFYPPLQV